MVHTFDGNMIPSNWQDVVEGYAIENDMGFWEAYLDLEQHLKLQGNIDALAAPKS